MATAEATPCECTEHPCVPVPAQHVRYRIRVGLEEQGLVKLCAHCYINGHMSKREYTWRARKEGAA